jgi:hypothetical protein
VASSVGSGLGTGEGVGSAGSAWVKRGLAAAGGSEKSPATVEQASSERPRARKSSDLLTGVVSC